MTGLPHAANLGVGPTTPSATGGRHTGTCEAGTKAGSNDKVVPARKLPHGLTPFVRPRRLRTSVPMRRLVAETRWSPEQLILPVFVRDGISEPVEIPSMPGQYQHTPESLAQLGREAADAGIGGMLSLIHI